MTATTEFPLTAAERWAGAQQELFDGRNLRVGEHGRVHSVAVIDGFPEPACGQGYLGHGYRGELRPTVAPVDCRKCLRQQPGTPERLTERYPTLF